MFQQVSTSNSNDFIRETEISTGLAPPTPRHVHLVLTRVDVLQHLVCVPEDLQATPAVPRPDTGMLQVQELAPSAAQCGCVVVDLRKHQVVRCDVRHAHQRGVHEVLLLLQLQDLLVVGA